MKKLTCLGLVMWGLLLVGFGGLGGLAGCSAPTQGKALYQTSTINALLDGVYQGDLPVGELLQHGDTGIGTFDHLDGEMIVVDGKVWQLRAYGRVYPADDAMRTPFAAVVFFRPEIFATWTKPLDYPAMQDQLLTLLPSRNAPYAIRMEGEFSLVRVRSVPRQDPPFRRLTEIVKTQPVFERVQVRGTLIGFWLPQFTSQLNVPGYHFHFLNEQRTFGGHVLDCRPQNVQVAITQLTTLELRIPPTPDFHQARLNPEEGELHKVEKGK